MEIHKGRRGILFEREGAFGDQGLECGDPKAYGF